MLDFLYSIDLSVFYFINHSMSAPFLNKFFSIITDVNHWYITYVILILWLLIKGGRTGRIAAIGVIILILVTDQVSAKFLKELFQRDRPCQVLKDAITPLGCQGTWSFPSVHAVNNFAAAVFLSFLFPGMRWIFFVTAFLISLSRVYLGLHYPSDILAGALIGAVFGYIFGIIGVKTDRLFQRGKPKGRK